MLGYELTFHSKSYSTNVTWSIRLGKLRRLGIVVDLCEPINTNHLSYVCVQSRSE